MSRPKAFSFATLLASILVATCSNILQACPNCGHCFTCGQTWTWVEVEEEYVVKVPFVEKVERTVTVSKPYTEPAEVTYETMVPHSETRTGTRTIRHAVPETKMVTVSRDFGRWVTPLPEPAPPCGCETGCAADCASGCASSCHHVVSCCDCPPSPPVCCDSVWVADVRTKEIPVTTYRIETEEVPYEYTHTEWKAEQRTKTIHVVKYKQEEVQQEYNVTRYREETRVRTVCVRQPTCNCGPVACGTCE